MRAILPRFLLVSAGAHVLALGLMAGTAARTAPQHLGLAEISVRLAGAPQTSRDPEPEPNKVSRSAPPPTPVAAAAAAAARDTSTGREVPTGAAEAAVQNFLLGELQTRLARYLTYPPLARARGWQGTVLIDLRVESDGRIERVQLARSSGYDVLDRSALTAFRRIERLAETTARLGGREHEMQLPVIYRLIEN